MLPDIYLRAEKRKQDMPSLFDTLDEELEAQV